MKMKTMKITNTRTLLIFNYYTSEVDDEGSSNPLYQAPANNVPKPQTTPRQSRVNPDPGAYRGSKCRLPDDFLQVCYMCDGFFEVEKDCECERDGCKKREPKKA